MLSIFCDGSSHSRGGLPGGWAFILVENDVALVTRTGGEKATTNNLMELRAALFGLQEVLSRGPRAPLELVSDSRFALDIANGSYLPSKHVTEARALRAAALEAGAQTRWVRGHSGILWNERVDALAHEAKQALVPARVRRKAELRARTR